MRLSSLHPHVYSKPTINKPALFFHPILAALFIPTLYKMEQGQPSVSMGTWVKALSMLGKLDPKNPCLPDTRPRKRSETDSGPKGNPKMMNLWKDFHKGDDSFLKNSGFSLIDLQEKKYYGIGKLNWNFLRYGNSLKSLGMVIVKDMSLASKIIILGTSHPGYSL